MDFHIESWIKEYVKSLTFLFGDRLWFVGLQGSYGRGEATQESDIDVVVILDKLTCNDLENYSNMLDALPHRDKVCGFISGKDELLGWEPSDLFQFYFDTIPIVGSLEVLREKFKNEDVQRAVLSGVCNIYHMCAHNMVHEKDRDLLHGLYKSAFFVLQAISYLKNGSYVKGKEALSVSLEPKEQAILETYCKLKSQGHLPVDQWKALSEALLFWSSYWIERISKSEY